MSFYRDEIRTARKDHKCDLCHGKIEIGEKYHNKAGNDGSMIWDSKECEKCQSVKDEFYKETGGDDGYCDDFIRYWWREEKCHKCKDYWPECNPNHTCKEPCDCKENGKCTGGDYCDKMTHYCRCENFVNKAIRPEVAE